MKRFLMMLGILSLMLSSALANQPSLPSKAERYLEVLRNRPQAGVVFDRFYEAALEALNLDDLEKLLVTQAAADTQGVGEFLLGLFYHKQGETENASKALQAAIVEAPRHPAMLYQKAIIEEQRHAFAAALVDLEKAFAASPDAELEREILQRQGALEARRGDTATALKVWQQLLARYPEEEDLVEDVVILQEQAGLTSEAIATLRKLIDRTTDAYQWTKRTLRLGELLGGIGDTDQALAAYESALEKAGHETWMEKEIFAKTEELFRQRDDLEGLRAWYESSIEKERGRLQAGQRLAQVLADLGQEAACLKVYTGLLSKAPGNRTLQEAYIDQLAAFERFDQAAEQLSRLRQAYPDDPELPLKLAVLLERENDRQGCAKAVRDYLALTDQSEYHYLRAARLLARYHCIQEADQLYQELLAREPENEAAQDTYASHLYETERRQEAIERWLARAENGSRETVARIARTLSQRHLHAEALTLLASRWEDFSTDALYLAQLCREAVQARAFNRAVPWVREWVRRSSPGDLDLALDVALKIVTASDHFHELRDQLAGSTHPHEICLRAALLQLENQFEGAAAALASLPEDHSTLRLSQQVRLYEKQQDWDAAAETVRKLMKTAKGRSGASWKRLASFLSKAGRNEEALASLKEWKAAAPALAAPWIRESELLQELGRLEEAVEVLRSAARRFDDEPLKVLLVKAYRDVGRGSEARAVLLRLYEEAKSSEDKQRWAQELAENAHRDGGLTSLIQQFETRRRKNPQALEPLLTLAELYLAAGDEEAHRRLLREAALKHEGQVSLLIQLIRLELAAQNEGAALTLIRKVMPRAKKVNDRLHLARYLFQLGEAEEAYALMFEQDGQAPVDFIAVENLASTLAQDGEWETAGRFLDRVADTHPEQYRIGYLRALCSAQMNEVDTALAQWEALLELRVDSLSRPATPMAIWGKDDAPHVAVALYEMLHGLGGRFAVPRASGGLIMSNSMHGHRHGHMELPDSFDKLHILVLRDLIEYGVSLGKEDRNRILTIIKSLGEPVGDYIFGLQQKDLHDPTGLLERFPADRVLPALAVLYESSLRDEARHDWKAYGDRLAGAYPSLSITAYILSLFEDPNPQETLEAALDLMAAQSQLSPVVLSALRRWQNHQNEFRSAIPATTWQRLGEICQQWMTTGAVQGWERIICFSLVSEALWQSQQYDQLMRLLDDEVAQPLAVRSVPRRGRRGFEAIGFPAAYLPGYPHHVLEFINQHKVHVQTTPEFAAASAHVRCRIIQLHLAHHRHDEAREAEILQAMKEDPHIRLPEMALLGAYLETLHLDPRAASHWYIRATENATDPIAQAYLDTQALRVLRAELETAELPEDLLQAGQVICRRRSAKQTSYGNGMELVKLMYLLGMEKEAERTRLQVQNRSGRAARRYQSTRNSPTVTSSNQKRSLRELFESGESDRAIRRLDQEARRLANRLLRSHSYQSARNGLAIHGLDLNGPHIEAFLKSMESKRDSGFMDQFIHAVTLEALGKKDRVFSAYSKLMALQPEHLGVSRRLIHLAFDEDLVEEALEEMETLPAQALVTIASQLGDQLDQRLQSRYDPDRYNGREMLYAKRLFVHLLEKLQDVDEESLLWLPDFAGRVAGLERVGSALLGHLYDQDRTRFRSYSERLLLDQRRELHHLACAAMLRLPRLARDGFRRMAQGEAIGEKVSHHLVEQARRVCLSMDLPVAASPAPRLIKWEASRHAAEWSPEAYFLHAAWSAGDRSRVETLLKKLKNRSPDWLDFCRSLERYAEALFGGESRELPVNQCLAIAVLTGDEEVNQGIHDTIGGVRSEDLTNLPVFAAHLFHNQGQDALEHLFDRAPEAFDVWRTELHQHAILLFPLQTILTKHSKWADRAPDLRALHPLEGAKLQDVERSLALLEATPFLKDLSDFRFGFQPVLVDAEAVAGDLGRYWSLFEHVGNTLQALPWDLKDRYVEHFTERVPDTFGRSLLLARMDDEPLTACTQVIHGARSEIEALPLVRQLAFALFCERLLGNKKPPVSLNWLTSLRQSRQERLARIILSHPPRDIRRTGAERELPNIILSLCDEGKEPLAREVLVRSVNQAISRKNLVDTLLANEHGVRLYLLLAEMMRQNAFSALAAHDIEHFQTLGTSAAASMPTVENVPRLVPLYEVLAERLAEGKEPLAAALLPSRFPPQTVEELQPFFHESEEASLTPELSAVFQAILSLEPERKRHFRDWLADDRHGRFDRMQVAEALMRQRKLLPPDMIVQIVQLYLDWYPSRMPDDQLWIFASMLNDAFTHPQASVLAGQVIDRLVGDRSARGRFHAETWNLLFVLAAQLENESSVDRLLSLRQGRVPFNAVYDLVMAGKHAQAAKLFTRHWRVLEFVSAESGEALRKFDDAVSSRLDGFLAALPDHSLRLYGEALFVSLADNPAKIAAITSRAKRLEEFASRLGDTSFPNPELELAMLGRLARFACTEKLAGRYTKAAEGITRESWKTKDARVVWNHEILRVVLLRQIHEDLAKLPDALAKLSNIPIQATERQQILAKELLRHFMHELNNAWTRSPQNREKLAGLWREVLSQPGAAHLFNEQLVQAVAYLLVTHAVLGKPDPLTALWPRVNSHFKAQLMAVHGAPLQTAIQNVLESTPVTQLLDDLDIDVVATALAGNRVLAKQIGGSLSAREATLRDLIRTSRKHRLKEALNDSVRHTSDGILLGGDVDDLLDLPPLPMSSFNPDDMGDLPTLEELEEKNAGLFEDQKGLDP